MARDLQRVQLRGPARTSPAASPAPTLQPVVNQLSGFVAKEQQAQFQKEAERIQREAEAFGTKDGLNLTKRDMGDPTTVAAKAYARANQRAYVMQTGISLSERASQIQREAQGDAQAAENLLKANHEAILEKTPEQYRADLQLEMARVSSRTMNAVIAEGDRKARDLAAARIDQTISGALSRAQSEFMEGDVEAFARWEAHTNALINDGIASGTISAQYGFKQKRNIKKNLEVGVLQARFLSVGKDRGWLDEKRNEYMQDLPEGWTFDDVERTFNSFEKDIEVDRQAIQSTISDAVLNASSTGDNAAALEQRIFLLGGDQDMAEAAREEVTEASRRYHVNQDFNNLSLQEMQSRIAAKKNDVQPGLPGASMRQAEFEADAEIAEQIVKRRNADPARYVAETDPSLATYFSINDAGQAFVDPDVVGQRLQKQADLGIADPKPFTQDEISHFVSAFQNATNQGRVGIVAELQSMAGEYANDVFAAIAEKDVGSVSVAAGVAFENDPVAAQNIISGQQMVQANPALKPSREQIASHFRAATGGALSMHPQTEKDFGEAAAMIYVTKLAEAGIDPNTKPDQGQGVDFWEESVNEATGGLVELGGVPLIPPRRGMSQEEMNGILGATILPKYAVNAFGVPPNDRRLTAIRPRLQWIEGSKYYVMTGDAPVMDNRVDPDSNGVYREPLVLDLLDGKNAGQ